MSEIEQNGLVGRCYRPHGDSLGASEGCQQGAVYANTDETGFPHHPHNIAYLAVNRIAFGANKAPSKGPVGNQFRQRVDCQRPQVFGVRRNATTTLERDCLAYVELREFSCEADVQQA